MNPHFTKRGIRPSGPVRQASSRQQRFVDGPFWFKLLVPDTVVGMIMGMRGSTIMRLEKENCAVVRFSPYSHYFPGTDKRIIIGATANLSNLYSLVNTVVSDYIFRKNEQTSEIMIVVGSENALNLAVSASSGFLDCSVVTYYDNEWVLSLKPAIEHSEMDPSFLAHVVASVVIAVQVDRDGMVHSSRYLYHPVPNVVKATASSSSINDDNDDDDDIDQLLNAYPCTLCWVTPHVSKKDMQSFYSPSSSSSSCSVMSYQLDENDVYVISGSVSAVHALHRELVYSKNN